MAPASGQMFEAVDPSNRQVFHKLPRGNAEDIDRAVKAARRAFDDGPWPRMSGAERAAVLRRMGDEIAARADELARIEVQDNGKPLPEAVWDIEDTAGVFHFYAILPSGWIMPPNSRSSWGWRVLRPSVKEPVGVAGAIIPWNFPLLMASWKVAPARRAVAGAETVGTDLGFGAGAGRDCR